MEYKNYKKRSREISMKKFLLLFTALVLVLSVAACGNEESSKKSTKSNKHNVSPVPKEVFSSDKINEKISEQEIKKDLTVYLNTYNDLFDNIEQLRYKDDLTNKEVKKLNKLTALIDKNDDNFSNFINNNTLPKGYKSGTFKTMNYVSSTNQFLNKINRQVQK